MKRGVNYRLLFTAALFSPILFAQTPSHKPELRSVSYTAAQAQQGKAIYQEQCSMCHGDALEGDRRNSPLAGAEFVNHWAGQSMADLFMKTIVMMPAMAPGTMTPKDTAAVLAYILSENKFPAGQTELSTDPRFLEMIPITKP